MTTTGPDLAANLDALRGLHLPTASAGGLQGEVVAAIALGFTAALLVGLIRLLRARAGNSVRCAALRELTAAKRLEPEARLVAQARLLRRLARTLVGDAAASSRGPDWAATLDRLFSTDFFSRGAGGILADGLYRRPERPDPAAIDAELARLFARIRA